MSPTRHFHPRGAVRLALGHAHAVIAVAVTLASAPAHAQSPGGPGLMHYDLQIREPLSGQSLRVVGDVAMSGSGVLIRQCLLPAPFALMVCQWSANGESSPPMLMPPQPSLMGVRPGPWAGMPGPLPGIGSLMDPAGALDRLFSPPPGVPGWQMQASGRGTWMGLAAQGTFAYWQSRH